MEISLSHNWRRQCHRFLNSPSQYCSPYSSNQTKFRQKTHKTRVKMIELPNELWLITFDLVIEEGTIRLDRCDYTTFPIIGSCFFHSVHCYQFYDSYYRLRLVCRRFNAILGARPWQSFSDSSSLPFPITTRSLYLHLESLGSQHFQRLFAETSRFGRLVSLDVDCGISPCYFLEASPGQTFPNVQRLVLRVANTPFSPPYGPFWRLVNCAFPLLVTFVLIAEHWFVPGQQIQRKEDDEIVSFEQLEILYLHSRVLCLECRFPRLRHASISACSESELEILIRSPHLQSLLIRSHRRIDVSSCERLKLLGFEHHPFCRVVPLGLNHPVENVWIYCSYTFPDPDDVFPTLWKIAPRAHRIIVEFPSSHEQNHWRKICERIGMPYFNSFGLSMMPPVALGDRCLVFEWERAVP
jgi:hypothetical protein